MRRIPEAWIIKRAWQDVEHCWKKGEPCGQCDQWEGFGGSYDEPPWSQCFVLEAGENPFACPGVKRSDVEETLEAEAIEAADQE